VQVTAIVAKGYGLRPIIVPEGGQDRSGVATSGPCSTSRRFAIVMSLDEALAYLRWRCCFG
jgi:hypothetical protein